MAATASRPPPSANNLLSPTSSSNDTPTTTGHGEPPRPAPQPVANTAAKKSKGKKAADPVDTGKLLNDTIAQLEGKQGREKSEEQEIEREVKKANRDLSQNLAGIQSPLQKVETVVKKYGELYADMKRMERDYIKSKKRGDTLQKEKDTTKSEFNKAQTKLGTLEKLSRDFEKDNKRLRDENRRLQESEAEKRNELHERLESMAAEVEQSLAPHEYPDESTTDTMEQDELFREKFKSFVDQYDLREIQFHSLLRIKDLELAQLNQQLTTARAMTDSESMKSRQLTSQVSTFSQTETELRSQLNIYVDKFKQVEETLNNSNDLFLTFRKEMEEMSKKTKRLEKENHNLTRKQNLTNHNIATMAQDRIRLTNERDVLKRKNEELERLCRGMQAQGRGSEDVEKQLQQVQKSERAANANTASELPPPGQLGERSVLESKVANFPRQPNGSLETQLEDMNLADDDTGTADEEEDEDEDDSDYEYEEDDSEDDDDDDDDSLDDEEYEDDDTEDLRGELAALSKDAASSPKRGMKTPPAQSPKAKSPNVKSPGKAKANGRVNGVK